MKGGNSGRRAGAAVTAALSAWLLHDAASLAMGATPEDDPLRRARTLADGRRYTEALPLVDRLLEAHPDEAEALALRADLLRAVGRTIDARADYEHLARLRPGDPEPWFWLGTIDRWAGQDQESVRNYTRAIDVSRCHLDALKGRARSLRHQGKLDEAEADLHAALACRSDDAEAAELLADTLAKRGDRRQAEGVLHGAFQGAGLEIRLGDLSLSSGRPADAVEHYTRALAEKPQDASLYRRLGDAERERGRSAAALEAYRRAVRLEPGDVGSLYWIGVLAAREGRRDEALEAYERMLAAKPDDASALVGKARLLHWDGRDREALGLVEKALASSPNNEDARILRASILASQGRTDEARRDYLAVIARSPGSSDAWHGLDRLGTDRSFGLTGRYDRNEVVEGLDEAGLQTGSGIITPTRVEYLTEGAAADLRWALDDRKDLVGELSAGREAVTNLDTGGTIYDYDLLDLAAGMDHRLTDRWSLVWRLGGTRYSPRNPGTIATESHFKGKVGTTWTGSRDRFSANVASDSFIWRGFAGDTQFRIFDRNRLWADWERGLARSFSVSASAGVSHFDDGNTVPTAAAALGWSSGSRAASLRYRHDPFPARFLTVPDRRLDFIDFDALSLTGRTPLAGGFRLSGELLAGRFGATPRTVVVNNVKTEGPLERNTQRLLRATLAWSPPTSEGLTLGVEYFSDHYAFDTGPYNNNNLHSLTPFVEWTGDAAPRWHFALRYAHGFVGDEREASYGSNSYYADVQARLGNLERASGTPRLGVELLRRDDTIPENGEHYRFYLTFPF